MQVVLSNIYVLSQCKTIHQKLAYNIVITDVQKLAKVKLKECQYCIWLQSLIRPNNIDIKFL